MSQYCDELDVCCEILEDNFSFLRFHKSVPENCMSFIGKKISQPIQKGINWKDSIRQVCF